MAAALVAAVLAVVLGHWLPALTALRRFEWFGHWRRWLSRQLHADLGSGLSGVLLLLLPPVLLLAALQGLLEAVVFGLPGFLLGLLVLLWCWGPRDLDRDVEALARSDGPAAAEAAARQLSSRGEAVSTGGPSLVEAVFRAALQRWFAVLLWFLLLGPAGALLYRLTQLAADEPPGADDDSPLGVLRLVLEWPAAQLMTLALALAAHFDAVLQAWRDWHRARGSWLVADLGFLYAAARASVVYELAEAAQDSDADPRPDAVARLPSASALRDAMSLVWRILVVWLTVLALLVLAGYVG
jgi:AmpE protein